MKSKDALLIVNVNPVFFNRCIENACSVFGEGKISYFPFHKDKNRHPPKKDINYLAFVIHNLFE